MFCIYGTVKILELNIFNVTRVISLIDHTLAYKWSIACAERNPFVMAL